MDRPGDRPADDPEPFVRLLHRRAPTRVLDALAGMRTARHTGRLVDKSMVTVERTDNAVRYRLLDTLRNYGAARLAEAGAADTIRDAHAAYHIGLAEEHDSRIGGLDENAALAAIDAAFDDLRVAHEWLLDAGGVDGALRLSGALGRYLLLRLRLKVGEWAERALALPGANPTQACSTSSTAAKRSCTPARRTRLGGSQGAGYDHPYLRPHPQPVGRTATRRPWEPGVRADACTTAACDQDHPNGKEAGCNRQRFPPS